MKEKKPIFEIIVDGKIKKTIKGWDGLDDVQNDMDYRLRENGYEEIMKSSGGSYGYFLYFNEELLKSTVFAWRKITPFVDKNGQKIYYGDKIQYSSSVYELNECSEYSDIKCPSGYYIRVYRGRGWYDYPITAEEIREKYTVVRNIYSKILRK